MIRSFRGPEVIVWSWIMTSSRIDQVKVETKLINLHLQFRQRQVRQGRSVQRPNLDLYCVLNAATQTSNRIMNFRCNPPLLRHTHNSDHTGVRRRRTHFLQDTQKRSPATCFKQFIAQLALLDNLGLLEKLSQLQTWPKARIGRRRSNIIDPCSLEMDHKTENSGHK